MNLFLDKIIQKQRTDFNTLTRKKTESYPFPNDITELSDIPYLPDHNQAHCLSVYRPSSTERILPAIINVHGGGLVMGNKEFNRYFCAQPCKLSFVVFSIEYRLIPEANVFQQLSDVTAAMDFINNQSLCTVVIRHIFTW